MMIQLGALDAHSQTICSPFKGGFVSYRHRSTRWRVPAGYLESMSNVADMSSPVYASSGAQVGCQVHLSWHERSWSVPKARRGLITMSIPAKHWDGLLAILACSDAALRQVVQRWPGIAELTEADIMQLLMCLKALLPGCNVAAMVQLQPKLFLSKTTQQLQTQVGTAYDIISQELPTDYVDAMVQEKPDILFIDVGCLPNAVQQLKDMVAYPTDPTSLNNVLWAVKDHA